MDVASFLMIFTEAIEMDYERYTLYLALCYLLFNYLVYNLR